jgi:hypothetical protein
MNDSKPPSAALMNEIRQVATPSEAAPSKLKPAILWLCVLPGALAAYWVIQFVIIFASALTSVPAMWISFINGVSGPAAFVEFGAMIAPTKKFPTAIALTILHAVTVSVITTMFIQKGQSRWDVFMLIASGVAGVVATVFVCFSIQAREHDQK